MIDCWRSWGKVPTYLSGVGPEVPGTRRGVRGENVSPAADISNYVLCGYLAFTFTDDDWIIQSVELFKGRNCHLYHATNCSPDWRQILTIPISSRFREMQI